VELSWWHWLAYTDPVEGWQAKQGNCKVKEDTQGQEDTQGS
jgi:hypothetical protein